MIQRAELIRKSFNIAALVLFLLLVSFQYVETNRLENILDVRNAEINELRQADVAQKVLLAEFDVKTANQSQILKDLISDLDHRQKANEEKMKVINFFAAKHSEGQNAFVGLNAGASMQSLVLDDGGNRALGSFNSALGYGALALNRTGALNTAIGTNALTMNEDGSNNLAVGANSLVWNKSGRANVALGAAAMYRNVSGTHNTAVGMQTLYQLEDGHHNSAFGRDSLFSLKQGSWNAAFGVDSLPGLEVGQGNSAFGGEAGYTEIVDSQHRRGSFNSWFGYQSGPATLKQVSNSIAIGYRAKNTESNQTVIGNADTTETIIHGDVKVSTLCVGSICADAAVFEAVLRVAKRNLR